jgi:hypothetical protein
MDLKKVAYSVVSMAVSMAVSTVVLLVENLAA